MPYHTPVDDQWLAVVRRTLPCPIESVAVHDKGENFVVLEINGEWMFRFPRSEEKRHSLMRESQFLAAFAPHSPLPVPEHQFRLRECVGYRKIPGAEMEPDLFKSLSHRAQDHIVRQVAAFLSALHAFPATSIGAGLLENGWGGWRERAREVFIRTLLGRFTHSQRVAIADWFEECASMQFTRVPVHGDFTPDHILFDPEAALIRGIIDWGDVTLDDPATDLYHLQEAYGGQFCAQVVSSLSQGDKEALERRIAIRSRAERLYKMVYFYERGFLDRLASEISIVQDLCSRAES